MHLALRLAGEPFRVFETGDPVGRDVGYAVVGGARAAFYGRDVSGPALSLGAQLLPGASLALLAIGAHELAGRHTPLDRIWGRAAEDLRERAQLARSPQERLDALEEALLARLARSRSPRAAIVQAASRLAHGARVDEVVATAGTSHRRFIELFREVVGLSPKLYGRVRRFRRAIALVTAQPALSWLDVALAAGYSDQPHFNREFLELSGLTPEEYRRSSPSRAHHVVPARAG
jgi:AraC-like DNA-binding protein